MIAYQVAIVRFRLDALAGELVNVGLVMWLPRERRLQFRLNDRSDRLATFFRGFDPVGYRQQIEDLRDRWRRVAGHPPESESIVDVLPALLADDAAVFQWSVPFGGAVADPGLRFEQLYASLVTRHEHSGEVLDQIEADLASHA